MSEKEKALKVLETFCEPQAKDMLYSVYCGLKSRNIDFSTLDIDSYDIDMVLKVLTKEYNFRMHYGNKWLSHSKETNTLNIIKQFPLVSVLENGVFMYYKNNDLHQYNLSDLSTPDGAFNTTTSIDSTFNHSICLAYILWLCISNISTSFFISSIGIKEFIEGI